MDFPQAWVEKIVHEAETHWLSGKEKFPRADVSKESYDDNILGY